MRLIVKYTNNGDTSCLGVSIDPSKFFHDTHETPTDIVLGSIIRHYEARRTLLTLTAHPDEALQDLAKNGLDNHRSMVLPQAVAFNYFRQSFIPEGCEMIHFDRPNQTVLTHTGETFSTFELSDAPQDRIDHKGATTRHKHPFATRYAADGICHPSDIDAGSFTAGIFQGLIGSQYGLYTAEAAKLLGLLLIKANLAFHTDQVRQENGAMSMVDMRDHFARIGLVLSDRAWMPRQYLEGVRFKDAVAQVSQPLFDLGRDISGQMRSTPSITFRLALDIYLEQTGLSMRDLSHIPLSPAHIPSSHDLMQANGLLISLTEKMERAAAIRDNRKKSTMSMLTRFKEAATK